MLDIDHFKKINDTYGHAFGDIVIANTAGLAQDVFGNGNIFRVGGEEFIAIIEADSAHEVVRQVETMRARMAAFVHAQEEVSIQCTVSIGFTLLDTLRPHEDAFRAADKALYTAKRMGRDRAIQATPKPGPNDGPAAKLELRFEEGEQHRFAAPAASYGNLALRSND
jgi:diguanylate cyclase (GGDEF)-like protein